MKITQDVKYVGVTDNEIDLFEGQFAVPVGMRYNSYVVLDEKIAVFDTVDRHFVGEWLKNVKNALGARQPDYLVIQHMEGDHSAGIADFLKAYPNATVVGNRQTFSMIQKAFGADICLNKRIISDFEKLSLGRHELQFIFAPMVHWPEVFFTYDAADKILFSADAFGKFGRDDTPDDWACEARRYYFGIVAKYGDAVQKVLKKAAALDIKIICPLHGPVLSENLDYYLNLYDTWSCYGVESEGVCIAYTSVYGNTKAACEYLAEKLTEKGVKVAINDLARCDMAEAVEDAFRYGKLVLATTTYNADIFPFMNDFLAHLTMHNYQNRTVGYIENGSWSPCAIKCMKARLANSKNITPLETEVTLNIAFSEANRASLDKMAEELAK